MSGIGEYQYFAVVKERDGWRAGVMGMLNLETVGDGSMASLVVLLANERDDELIARAAAENQRDEAIAERDEARELLANERAGKEEFAKSINEERKNWLARCAARTRDLRELNFLLIKRLAEPMATQPMPPVFIEVNCLKCAATEKERDEARAEAAKLKEQLSKPEIFWDAEEMDGIVTHPDAIVRCGQGGLIVRIARAVVIPDQFGFRIDVDGEAKTFYFDTFGEAETELAKMRPNATGPSLPQKSLDHIFICRDGCTDIDGTHYPASADGQPYWVPITPNKFTHEQLREFAGWKAKDPANGKAPSG